MVRERVQYSTSMTETLDKITEIVRHSNRGYKL